MEALQIAVAFVMVTLLVKRLKKRGTLLGNLSTYRELKPRHFAWGLLSVTLTVLTWKVLDLVPALRWGWWSMVGGHGSVLSGASDATSSSPALALVPLVLAALVLLLLPSLARSEEEAEDIGRMGAQRRNALTHAASCLGFGLMHLGMGVPVSAALALSLAGGVFTLVYLRAQDRAARALWEQALKQHSGYMWRRDDAPSSVSSKLRHHAQLDWRGARKGRELVVLDEDALRDVLRASEAQEGSDDVLRAAAWSCRFVLDPGAGSVQTRTGTWASSALVFQLEKRLEELTGRVGTHQSTLVHTAHNLLVVAPVALLMAAGVLLGA
jgi:hypothetical protein